MAKAPICPRHKGALSVRNGKIEFSGTAYQVCIGTCPKCSVQYISQRLMAFGTISIGGHKYEYLEGLSDSSKATPLSNKPTSVGGDWSAQDMADIEAHFIAVESETQSQIELDRLTRENESLCKQNGNLQSENESLRKQNEHFQSELENNIAIQKQREGIVREIEALHAEEVNRLKVQIATYQASIKRLNSKVETYQSQIKRLNTQISENIESYQSQIKRLIVQINEYKTQIQRRNAAENRKDTNKALELEHLRLVELQRRNKLLEEQVAACKTKLAEARGPRRQVMFVDEKLYICGGQIRCEKYGHDIEEVTGIIDTIQGASVQMTVCHCTNCKLYYIHDTVFDTYRTRTGGLLGQFIRKSDGMKLGQPDAYGELAIESILHMNGYNVNQTVNLTPEERHRILSYMIESRIMSKQEIRNHLSSLIRRNRSTPLRDVAVSRWEADIRWVNDYHTSKQDMVWLSGTAMYKHWQKR
ncbi:MAG: hypothetical protein ACI4ME_02435 [Aristaeellaceae bacterium]